MAKPEPESDPRLAARNQRLNVLFALSSLGLLGATGLLVWADYDREWRQYQMDFVRLRVQHTKEQIEKALGPEDAQRLRDVEALLQQGRDEAAAQRDDIRKVEEEIDSLQAHWSEADQDYRFTKAKLDVARYELDAAIHEKSPRVQARREDARRLERRWGEGRLEVEDLLGRSEDARKRLAELRRVELEAEKARASYKYDELVFVKKVTPFGIKRIPEIKTRKIKKADEETIAEAKNDMDLKLASLENALRAADRLKDGPDTDQLAQAEARLALAEAQVRAGEEAIANLELRAPFDGVICKLDIRAGEWVTPCLPILRLGDLGDLRVETTDLSEIDAARVHPQDTVLVTFDALPDLLVNGTVLRVANKSAKVPA